MFSYQKMAAYLVTWSSDIKSDIINELPHHENLYDEIYLNCVC